MAAIAECTKNPMAIFQYQNDEQVPLALLVLQWRQSARLGRH